MKEKILIAISDASLAQALDQALQKANFKTFVARDGKEALEKMQSFIPDLALIDTTLAIVNGYDILNQKNLNQLIAKIPVIIVSNTGTPIQIHRIPSTPTVKEFIIKTHIEPDEVVEKIKTILGGAPQPSAEKTKGTGKKVLWVEDDKLLSAILSKKIQDSGHILLKANNGEEALKILETETPDLILLDILLPGMDGFDILQAIRTQEKFRKTPAMMLSNMSKQSDIEKAKMLGVQKFVVKAAASLDEIIRDIDLLA